MNVAFVHIMKTAGSTINDVLSNGVLWPKRYILFIPGSFRKRDWSDDELREFLDSNTKRSYVINHANNWSTETIRAYLQQGWFTFSFYRHPGDQWCSFYFWSKESYDNRHAKQNPRSETMSTNLTLDEFLSRGWSDHSNLQQNNHGTIQNLRRNLDLPECWREMNFVAIYSSQTFSSFLYKYFGKETGTTKLANPSSNRGYQYYRDQGLISDRTHELLMNSQRYRDYQTILAKPHEHECEHFLTPKSNPFFESSRTKAKLVRYVVLLQSNISGKLLAKYLQKHPLIRSFGEEFETFPQSWAKQKIWLDDFSIRFPKKDESFQVLGFQTKLGSIAAKDRFRSYLEREQIRVIHVETKNPIRLALYDVCSQGLSEPMTKTNRHTDDHDSPKTKTCVSVQDFRAALNRIPDPAELTEFASRLNVPKLRVKFDNLLCQETTVLRQVSAHVGVDPFIPPQPAESSARPSFDIFGDLSDVIMNLDELKAAFPEYERYFADES